jgi:hypothetical protein
MTTQITKSVSSATVRGVNSSLKFSQVKLADSILAAAQGSRLQYGDKTIILSGDLESRRRFVLKLAGKL